MEVVYRCCAGLDVHKKTVVACRMAVRGTQVEQGTETFGTTTRELVRLKEWLGAWQITHVAMESTGDYWRPVYNVLEGACEILLVNAQHVKNVPGRKTDVKDAEWLADLLRHGLLKASYVPDREQRALRDLTRYRTKLVQDRVRVVNRIQKLLEDANIKLASVAANVMGVSGRAMMEAMLAGECDGVVLAKLAQGRMKAKRPQLEEALTGYMTEDHCFLLGQRLALFDFLSRQITELDERIAAQMAKMDQAALAVRDTPAENEASPVASMQGKDAHSPPLTHAQALALLDTIPGVNRLTAEVMVAEMGLDMSRFPSSKHLASWTGIAPGQHESAGKRYSGRTRRGNRWLFSALTQASWAASRAQYTYLKARYHRLAARRGKNRAIVAGGHAILVAAYHMLTNRQPYQEVGHDFFDQRQKDTTVRHLLRRLEKLGVEAPDPVATGVSGRSSLPMH
jgi:transposase